ncbi:peptide chain release factor N(5)-glutamine methyltransferase [Thermovibrio sp.]
MKWKVGELLKRATEILRERGSKSPRLDAELLLVHALGFKSRVELYTNFDKPLTEREVEKYRKLIVRRAKGEPVAYIIGKKEFFGFEFKVERGVLIPRPETEILVEEVYERIKGKENLTIVDVGTGSGCIAITLCKLTEGKHKIIGVDISERAIRVARENARRLGCKVEFIRNSLLKGIKGKVDAVVSNPPYIPLGDERVETEVLKYEPAVALFGGKEGTEVIEALVKESSEKVKEGGFIALEFGEGQGEKVKEILEKSGFKRVKLIKDLAGIERIAVGEK